MYTEGVDSSNVSDSKFIDVCIKEGYQICVDNFICFCSTCSKSHNSLAKSV